MKLTAGHICLVTFLWTLIYASVESKSVIRHIGMHKRHHRLHHQEDDNDIGMNDPEDERKAMEHSNAVADFGTCDIPKQQVIHINDHYPDINKYYLPHCTLLHRCGKHAGCCGTDKLRCVAAEKEKVTLYFYSVKIRSKDLPIQQTIEKLVFTNHTKCACALDSNYRHDL